jgi:hypothetical protein
MNEKRQSKVNMSVAYCITPSEDRDDMQLHYGPFYSRIDSLSTIVNYRNGKPARNFFIYKLSGWKGQVSVIHEKK